MLVDLPSNPTPTPPPTERPVPTGAPDGQVGHQYAPPAEPEMDVYSNTLDEVHRIWSNALDEPTMPQAPSAQGPKDTPFHDELARLVRMPPMGPAGGA